MSFGDDIAVSTAIVNGGHVIGVGYCDISKSLKIGTLVMAPSIACSELPVCAFAPEILGQFNFDVSFSTFAESAQSEKAKND